MKEIKKFRLAVETAAIQMKSACADSRINGIVKPDADRPH
jgi:hypothetical protein